MNSNPCSTASSEELGFSTTGTLNISRRASELCTEHVSSQFPLDLKQSRTYLCDDKSVHELATSRNAGGGQPSRLIQQGTRETGLMFEPLIFGGSSDKDAC